MSEQWVQVYCDGSCIPQSQGAGAWASLYLYKGKSKMVSGSCWGTTNNRMELQACIGALDNLNRACKVVIFTDSQYVKKGITEWIYTWKRKGWKNAKGGQVQNQDLWTELLRLCKKHTVEWNWIPGHVGHPYHDQVDREARRIARELAASI